MSESIKRIKKTDLGRAFFSSQDFYAKHVPGWGDEITRIAALYDRLGDAISDEEKDKRILMEMKRRMSLPYTYNHAIKVQ